MNTEDQLHHAAAEMERVTASLTPPPIGEVKRSVRVRAAGVAVVAAVVVVVLVGGVVVALRPSGPTTISPAGPTETTSTQLPTFPVEVDGIAVSFPDVDPPPSFDVGDDVAEMPFPAARSIESDVRRSVSLIAERYDGHSEEVMFLGSFGGYRSFVLIGGYSDRSDETGDAASFSRCLVTLTPDGARYGCGGDLGFAIDRLVDISDAEQRAMYGVMGQAPEGSSVVIIDVDGVQTMVRTRTGFVFLTAAGAPASTATYSVFDEQGSLLDQGKIWEPPDPSAITTTAVAVEDDGSCSASGHYSDGVLREDLPEPVIQTLGKILLFADRCWFEELAQVAAENFTASFGGDDAAELWALQEEQGSEPMAALLQILDMPYGTSEVEGRVLYIWPAAAAHDGDWETVPQDDKDALLSLYTAEDLAAFSGWGGYIGYRLGIFDDGDWSFFVEGD